MVYQYSSNRKSKFVPRAYLSLEQAIIKLCEAWFYENLSDFFEWANKDHDGRGTETAEHVRLDNLAQETFNRLRGYLYDETIIAEVVRPESGMREPVPAFYWGSEDADKVVYEGYIKDNYNYEVSYSGRVLIKEEDIIRVSGPNDSAKITKEPPGMLAISYAFTKKNPNLQIPMGYMCVDDAYDAFVSYLNSHEDGDADNISNQAKIIMLNLLRSGSIMSGGMLAGSSKIRELDRSAWVPDGVLTQVINKIEKIPVGMPHLAVGGGKPNAYLLISTDDVAAYMSGFGEPHLQDDAELDIQHQNENMLDLEYSAEEEKTSNGAGRPPDFDKDLFLIRAFEVLWLGGKVPDSRSSHCKMAIENYARANGGRKPSDSWAKPHIKTIWDVMGFKGGEEAPEGD